MELLLDRKWKKDKYTIGRLYVDGEFFCNTLEDTDRGLTSDMDIGKIKSIKIQDKTAIPTGAYLIDMDTVSPSFGKKAFYMKICLGKVPRLKDVPGFSGILIHTGNKPEDTSGCILVGMNKATGQVLDSQATFINLYSKLEAAHKNNETIRITIK